MSDADRVLARLARPGAILALVARGGRGFGVFAKGDRRRRPLTRLTAAEVRSLEAEGVIARDSDLDGFILSSAGEARLARATAASDGEAFVAQHRRVVARTVMDKDGERRTVRGHDPAESLRKMAAFRDVNGGSWFGVAELRAAEKLRADWELGQIGIVRGSDLAAPPKGSASRGAGNAAEHLVGARCDARRRVAEALGSLAPPLHRAVEAVCLAEEGLEAVERMEAWPPRSGKLALKLGLAQLAARG
jgi:hypothetical protein